MTEITSGELSLFRQSLEHNQRLDGRQNHESRELFVSRACLPYSEGSSCLEVEETQISCGVKSELVSTNSHQLVDQFFEVTVTGSAGESTHRQEMEMTLLAYVKRLVTQVQERLVVVANKKHWKLSIDVYVVG